MTAKHPRHPHRHQAAVTHGRGVSHGHETRPHERERAESPVPPRRPRRRLPGDLTRAQMIDRILRVDHAGEFGAQRIYAGQLAVLGRTPVGPTLRHMAEQEREHKETFDRLVGERRARPTLLSPLWHVAGLALGAGTALMGERAAMACTIAVEEVIGEHYQRQVDSLGEDEPELRATLERFRDEELEHRDIGVEHEGRAAPGYGLLSAAIKAGSRAAIWLSERV